MLFYAGTDSWIYILFGILWIAYAIYKGKNKAAKVAKTEKTVKDDSSSTSSVLEKTMESFLAPEDTSEDVREDRKEEPVSEPENIIIVEEDVPEKKKEEPTETSSQPKVRKINIKRAVIYSEILHRPYE